MLPDMFYNYNNIDPSYIPNNIDDEKPIIPVPLYDVFPKALKPIYNIKGRFLGYKWDYKDEFTLTFSANCKIRVRNDSIIYRESDQSPDSETVGKVGQRAYNLASVISWSCIDVNDYIYTWQRDDVFTYDLNGEKEEEIIVDMSGKTIEATITNFRGEEIVTFTSNTNEVICNIDSQLSEQLKPGTYYCTVSIIGTDYRAVKDKYLFNVK